MTCERKVSSFRWHRLDHTTIFFDSVYYVPEALQRKCACTFCDAHAEYAKLDSSDVPTTFYCGDHVFKARRGRHLSRQ